MELLFLNSLSKDGNMAESLEPGVGLKNSELFFNKNKIPIENTIFIDILDNNIIKEYDKSLVKISEYGVRYISADALITKKNNLFIYQKFGDCIPFTVYDTENNTLVFAHLGVVSVINLLHKEIIKKLTTEYSSNVKNLKCYLGPSIKKESYLKEINDNKLEVTEKSFTEACDLVNIKHGVSAKDKIDTKFVICFIIGVVILGFGGLVILSRKK